MFYGWIILIISMTALVASSPGQSFLVGKFSGAIETALGIEATTLTAAYGLATFLAAIPLLYVGRLADRFGPRIVMTLAAVLLGAACWLIGFARDPLTLGACYFLLRFAGQGTLSLTASHSLAMWFERRLGTATGIKTLAVPLAMLFLPPATTWLMHATDWRTAYGLLGAGVWLAMLPLAIFLHRNRPEDIGQQVDGADARPEPTGAEATEKKAERSEVVFTRGEAMSTSAYWIVSLAMALNALIGTAFVFMLSKLVIAAGLAPGSEDSVLAVFAIGSAVFSPAAGVLADRVPPHYLVGSASAALGLSCAAFALAGGLALAWTSMLLLAASQTVMFVAGGTLFARFYGRPHHGAIRASLTFTIVVGTSAGPFLTALLAERFDYAGALWVLAATCAPMSAAGWALRRPGHGRRPDSEQAQSTT